MLRCFNKNLIPILELFEGKERKRQKQFGPRHKKKKVKSNK